MSEVKVDTISERTAAGGVTIDGVLIKDSIVNTDNIAEKTAAAGVTIDGVLVKDGVATFQTAAGSPLVFEGATADAFETTFAITDPTADRTITFPDSSFTVPTAGGLFSSYAHIVDSKAEGTAGGTFTLGAWRTRDLNTEVTDPDGIVSIAANAFTLAAGSYLIKWTCPAHSVGYHKSRLYDVTGTAGIQNGMSSYAFGGSSFGAARVTPSGSNVYRIEHWCLTTLATYGFGVDTGTGTGVEIYAQVEILKES